MTHPPPRCLAIGTREYVQCEKPAGHDGPHYCWLPGFGGAQWPNTETQRV